MSKAKKSTIEVQGSSVTVLSHNQQDSICLTDPIRLELASGIA